MNYIEEIQANNLNINNSISPTSFNSLNLSKDDNFDTFETTAPNIKTAMMV